MTTRRGPGVFTTILMLIPMLAVPVMALFGVPHFMPVVASPTADASPQNGPRFLETRTGQSDALLQPMSFRVERPTDVDLFRPVGESDSENVAAAPTQPDSPLSEARRSWRDPLQPDSVSHRSYGEGAGSFFGSEAVGNSDVVSVLDTRSDATKTDDSDADKRRSEAHYQRDSVDFGRATQASLSQHPSLTWRNASRILTDLGVSTYSLSPGLSRGEFRFVCLVTSKDDPRVSRRFEANSSDPLAAVQQVIDQVSAWSTTEVR